MVMAQPPPLSSLALVSRPCHSSSLVFQLFRFCGSPVRTSSPTLLHQSLLLHDDPHGRRRLRLRNLRHRILRPLGKFNFQAIATTPEGAFHACMWQVGLVITLVVFYQTHQVQPCSVQLTRYMVGDTIKLVVTGGQTGAAGSWNVASSTEVARQS